MDPQKSIKNVIAIIEEHSNDEEIVNIRQIIKESCPQYSDNQVQLILEVMVIICGFMFVENCDKNDTLLEKVQKVKSLDIRKYKEDITKIASIVLDGTKWDV